jgi:putative membrane protein
MWIWHVPALCDTAAASQPVHYLQVFSLLLMGGMFWWPILGARPDQRLSPLVGVAYLFSACVSCSLLGIFITFAPIGVCPVYLHPEDRLGILPLIRERWGLTPAVDQQVGGLLMWVPACLVYLCGIMGLLARWYRSAEEEGRAFFQNPKSEVQLESVLSEKTDARRT